MVMTNPKKPNILDEITQGGRRLLQELERLLRPSDRQHDQRPAPVPVPVRPRRPHDPHQR